MKVRIGVLVGAIAALGLSSVADAAPSPYKVTGGGQALTTMTSDGVQGPGDTITFQAFIPATGVSDASTGKVNIIDRTEGGSGQGDHFRGAVECTFLETDGLGGGYVELYGTGIKDDVERDFVVRIRDNGQGDAADPDQIEFDLTVNEPPCEDSREDEEDVPEFFLARGNAKIHKENSGATKSSSAKSKSTSTTTSSQSLTSALTLR
jgi:hypothetical protein